MNKRIFMIEDEPDMIRIVTDLLQAEGFLVTSATHPLDALTKIRTNPPDMVLLDVRLPEMSGTDVCKELRADPKTKHLPIMMLSAKDQETDIIVGLEVGADDYVCKPYRHRELIARIHALLRRGNTEVVPQNIVSGPLTLNCHNYSITIYNKDIQLTYKEYELLSMLVRMEDRVLTRSKIYEGVWGTDFTGCSRTIDVHIDQLRRKLGKYSTWISTLKGIGYRFSIEE